ncbi:MULTISPECIES: bifunctional tetrahydrofolate synthase/dihydrofolate synthase [Lonsdalea]|uniref:Bifunctional tetrahydrofolate synthase/dihydrofolate synthase n=2 Tax=Lonsdalea TaxID=1082702 RepID=A0ACD1JFD7_9GAMM|nr:MULTISPECIES: bifunctional tetrahydrofolate synthase/dihydrofolate synthase [Lonsdalea]RAT15913.1 bifunctional tetrahydrofolate synthase/dihydrofolate synthase [Lonsdalea quercina]RAT18932.1 bifunctional tetrahydrofolate synthase/dihydrofolate synthase [Lonsdalea populi]RAT23503.1 bifunctional tetrahydrofolate synthase/dihydrofolate synthase [Lonsdalea populi]RAT26905.1 bifunctional tetrahydrofolate synthase/dihydrofolate synthase [Lonsdalea populi]RAT36150.1 bifunctional tetrahydrofolate s
MDNLQTPKAASPLATWLYYLEHLHVQAIDLGLDRIKQVADSLQLLQPANTIFTVAGTNGKGTTCCVLESILLAAGLRVGVYSSPHLLRYTERVRIQGKELPETMHSEAFAVVEGGRDNVSLTYFEFGTLAALHLFRQAQLDVVILEVGLGGRLDATNIVDSDVAVVTSIAIDHADWLGHDRESIGREKAGIFRHGKPAVVGEPDMPASIADVAHEKGARLLRRDVDWRYGVEEGNWFWENAQGRLSRLPLPNVPLPNAATALAALNASPLVVDENALRDGLRNAILPGRFQIAGDKPLLILDVAHNPHAAAYLSERLASLPPHGAVRAVVGMLSDKDIASTLEQLKPQVDAWYCAPLEGPRGASADLLAQHLEGSRSYPDVVSAWRAAMQDAKDHDVVVVCGSFHTVAHVMSALEEGAANGE